MGLTTVRIRDFPETEMVLSCDENGFIAFGGSLYERTAQSELRWRTMLLSMVRAIDPVASLDHGRAVLQSLDQAAGTRTWADNQVPVGQYRIEVQSSGGEFADSIEIEPDLGISYRSPSTIDESILLRCDATDNLLANGAAASERRFAHIIMRTITRLKAEEDKTVPGSAGDALRYRA
ncbi:hypothetical protein [Devosia sp. RR2S18]|uniref:hypothetical protein n=1 Tax=Devosia rhizosphaerae TaxID=3049774 RepID=UPI002541DD50|nr:hypothetical protein [Devosia sp. RR2S18]WIJ27201.1 hypothetical protein QOV41_03170 [Devosia sp. RR2S18]